VRWLYCYVAVISTQGVHHSLQLLDEMLTVYIPSLVEGRPVLDRFILIVPSGTFILLKEAQFVDRLLKRASILSDEMIENLPYLAMDGMSSKVREYNRRLELLEISVRGISSGLTASPQGCRVLLHVTGSGPSNDEIEAAREFLGQRFEGLFIDGSQKSSMPDIPERIFLKINECVKCYSRAGKPLPELKLIHAENLSNMDAAQYIINSSKDVEGETGVFVLLDAQLLLNPEVSEELLHRIEENISNL
jgi:hypothetical protein